MYKYTVAIFISLFLVACTIKQPVKSQSATVIFKTPLMKFYDKGFISKYDNHIHLQIFNVGQVVLDLTIYEDRICQSSLECLSSKEFNQTYLDESYEDRFLYELFSQSDVRFKDKEKRILIKVIKD